MKKRKTTSILITAILLTFMGTTVAQNDRAMPSGFTLIKKFQSNYDIGENKEVFVTIVAIPDKNDIQDCIDFLEKSEALQVTDSVLDMFYLVELNRLPREHNILCFDNESFKKDKSGKNFIPLVHIKKNGQLLEYAKKNKVGDQSFYYVNSITPGDYLLYFSKK